MPSATQPRWARARKRIAQDTSATFYGIIATLTAALPVRADQVTVEETLVGAMIVGLVGMANRCFMEALKQETELGRHLRWKEVPALLRDSALALLFPAVGATIIGLGALMGVTLESGLQTALYLGVLMAFISVFLSRLVLDQRTLPALRRASIWTTLTILLLAARKLAV
jgi:hypothetical protein